MRVNPIDKLYFGVVRPTNHGLAPHNLFNHIGVKRAIATYRAKPQDEFVDNPLLYCFGDYWSRAEYEWVVRPWTGTWEPQEVDIYGVFVEPNTSLLMEMVDSITPAAAKAWLRKEKENG